MNERGQKRLLAIEEGYRESTQSWREVLLHLKGRGLAAPPKLAVGDGAMGFWAALAEVYPPTREQRCWVHKTANMLNRLPKGVQRKAKPTCRRSGWRPPGPRPSRRSTGSSRPIAPSIRRRSSC